MVVLGSFYSWISKYSWMSHLQAATKQDVHIPIVPDHYTEWTMHIPETLLRKVKEMALNLDALRRYNNPSQMTQLQELFLSRIQMIEYPTTETLLTFHIVEFHLPSDTRAGITPRLWVMGKKDRMQRIETAKRQRPGMRNRNGFFKQGRKML